MEDSSIEVLLKDLKHVDKKDAEKLARFIGTQIDPDYNGLFRAHKNGHIEEFILNTDSDGNLIAIDTDCNEYDALEIIWG